MVIISCKIQIKHKTIDRTQDDCHDDLDLIFDLINVGITEYDVELMNAS